MRLTLACLTLVAGCTTLDPIVAPDDSALDADATDSSMADQVTRDVVLMDANTGDVDASMFACGMKTCDSLSEYCHIAHDDGGTASDTCIAFPTTCTADGGVPTCACIPGSCACTQSGAEISVDCP